jgi:hypothetical protein
MTLLPKVASAAAGFRQQEIMIYLHLRQRLLGQRADITKIAFESLICLLPCPLMRMLLSFAPKKLRRARHKMLDDERIRGGNKWEKIYRNLVIIRLKVLPATTVRALMTTNSELRWT